MNCVNLGGKFKSHNHVTLEPVCSKNSKKVPDQLLVCEIGDL